MSEQALVRLSDYFGNRSLVELFRTDALRSLRMSAALATVGQGRLRADLLPHAPRATAGGRPA